MSHLSFKRNSSLPRVLIIDDEPSVCQFFKDLYDDMDILVDTVTEASEGIRMAEEDNYSLIFLDIKLKDADGIQLLKELRAENVTSKIIVISGYFTEDIIKEALDFGADGYLFKPLSVRDIIAKTYLLIETPETRVSFI